MNGKKNFAIQQHHPFFELLTRDAWGVSWASNNNIFL